MRWFVVCVHFMYQSAADTWNDWESAACSHYLVPCIVIITPALSAPLLPSLLAIVIVIDWCGGQNSAAWKGIKHASHNCPAIWSSPPPSHRLLLHPSIFLFLTLRGRKHFCRWGQIRRMLFSFFSLRKIEYNYFLYWTRVLFGNTFYLLVLSILWLLHVAHLAFIQLNGGRQMMFAQFPSRSKCWPSGFLGTFKCQTETWSVTGLNDTPCQRGKFISSHWGCHRLSCPEPAR